MLGIKKIFFLIIGLIVLLPKTTWADDYICACYYKNGGCDNIGANDELDCGDSCKSQLREENYDYYEYSEIETVIFEIQDRCSDAQVAQVATTSDTSSDSSSSTATWGYDLIKTAGGAPFVYPKLNVNIPDVSFTEIAQENGYITVNFLGEYVAGLYKYLLGIAALFAVVVLMIGGIEYIISLEGKNVSKAKTRINKALTGIALLSCVYIMLYSISPNFVFFNGLKIKSVDEVILMTATSGEEGGGTTSNSLGTLPEQCKTIVDQAKADSLVSCSLSDGFSSPVDGHGPNCSSHHWGGNYNWDYHLIKNLDWAAGWGTAIKAPFSGKVSYQQQTDTGNPCGNRIYLKSEAANITICHAKDFLDGNDKYGGSRDVNQGEIIGHVGGRCCAGQDGSAFKYTKCETAGTMCSNPASEEAANCDCQPPQQSGNTTGPHVHVTWSSSSNLIKCLVD